MKRIVASLLVMVSAHAMASDTAVTSAVAVTNIGARATTPLSVLIYKGVLYRGYVVPGATQGSYAFIGYIANTRNSDLQVRLLNPAEAASAQALRASMPFNAKKADREVMLTYLDPATVGGTGLEVGKGWSFNFAGTDYWYNPTSVKITKLTPTQAQLLARSLSMKPA